jgi:hypothetical protein
MLRDGLMEETENSQKPNNEGLRFSQEQYNMLIRCSKKHDLKEWNEWRRNNLEDILLEGADLNHEFLEHAQLCYYSAPKTINVYLNGAKFFASGMRKANLSGAYLRNADFGFTDLRGASLLLAHLEGAQFMGTHLQSARLECAIVDEETFFYEDCEIDRNSNFIGVGIDNARIYPSLKQLIEYNNRRLNWIKWYAHRSKIPKVSIFRTFLKKILQKEKNEEQDEILSKIMDTWRIIYTSPIRLFWLMSDYGRSTWRIIISFFSLAFLFALVYYLCGFVCSKSIISNLLVGDEGLVPSKLVFIRSLYFSVVTMTTLGFGDMHANCQSPGGHILLMIQVMLGYIILAALVTRFAVLFTAGGPSAKFPKRKNQ